MLWGCRAEAGLRASSFLQPQLYNSPFPLPPRFPDRFPPLQTGKNFLVAGAGCKSSLGEGSRAAGSSLCLFLHLVKRFPPPALDEKFPLKKIRNCDPVNLLRASKNVSTFDK